MRSFECPLISHLAGSATVRLPGTVSVPSQKAPCLREKRFETADALFTVEKRELYFPNHDTAAHLGENDQPLWFGSNNFAVVRTDTQQLLGVVSKQYEIVQNDSLLRMAEFIREEIDMDCVIVLSDGAKVCFTATLRGADDGHRPW